MTYIVKLSAADDYGVYSADGRRGPYGTPLLFRGPLDECIDRRKQ